MISFEVFLVMFLFPISALIYSLNFFLYSSWNREKSLFQLSVCGHSGFMDCLSSRTLLGIDEFSPRIKIRENLIILGFDGQVFLSTFSDQPDIHPRHLCVQKRDLVLISTFCPSYLNKLSSVISAKYSLEYQE